MDLHFFLLSQVDVVENLSLSEVSVLHTVSDVYLDKRAFMDCLGRAAIQGESA